MSKKSLKKLRRERRLLEAQKAAAKVQGVTRAPGKPAPAPVIGDKYTLPIVEIKKDLRRNLYYTLFATGAIIILKSTNFGFEQIKHFLKF